MSTSKDKSVCIWVDEKYAHHKQIEVGKIYLTKIVHDSIYVYDIKTNRHIGSYHINQFIPLREFNLDTILNDK